MRAHVRSEAAVADAENDAPGGLIVEHYRLDASRSLSRVLGVAASIVTLGAFLMAIAILLPRLDARAPLPAASSRAAIFRVGAVTEDGTPIVSNTSAWELGLGILGLFCIAAGAGAAIVGLRRVLTEESYLALRTDGAYFRRAGERSLLPWDEVEAVRWDAASSAVLFVRHDGSEWARSERYAGIEGAELAKRCAEVRRKALFGLLS